jgi:phosphohistidine phosphatase
MELMLWRHADAAPGQPDAQRPLTALGQAQATAAARWISARLGAPLRILVSPALRTQQTAQALALPVETHEALAVGGTADQLLATAGWPDAPGMVIVVGHQPVLGRVAALLLSGEEHEWALDTSSVCWIGSESGKAVLRENYQPPPRTP